MDENGLSNVVIGAAIEVRRHIGPGLLEAIYVECLLHELIDRGIFVEREVSFPVYYKNYAISTGYRVDLLVEKKLVLELKAVEQLLPVHMAQLLSYLKIGNLKLGLLINFNVPVLRDGIRRVANQL